MASRTDRAAALATLAGLAAVHFTLALRLFPLSEWRSALPTLTDDYAHRFYFASLRLEFLKGHGVLWGYDPFHMAGYPHSPLFPPLNVLYEFVFAALPFVPRVALYKALVLAPPIISPLLAALAALRAGMGRWVALMAASVCLAAFWTWVPLPMHLTGGLCFVLACFLAPLVIASLARYAATPGALAWGILAALTATALFIHPGVALVLAVPAATILVARARRLAGGAWLGLVLLAPVAIAANAIWIAACWRLRSTYAAWGAEVPGTFDGWFSLALISGRMGIPFYGLLFLALSGWIRTRRGLGEAVLLRPHLAGAVGGAICLVLFAMAGYSLGPAVRSEPYRFMAGAGALLVLPAAWGLASLVEPGRRPWWAAATSVALAALALAPFASGAAGPRLRATLPPDGERLVEWIRIASSPEGRVLVEDSGLESAGGDWRANISRPGHHWFGTHLPALLPLLTGREIVGGPFPGRYVVHQFTGFSGGRLFGKTVDSYSERELDEWLRLYNVHRAVVWSGAAKEVFDRMDGVLARTGEIGEFATYRVREEGSHFLRGRGRVEASWNRIVLSDVEPDETGTVVLSYHWWDGLAASPPVDLEPELRLRDPVPFIRIRNPPPAIEIETDY